MLFLISIVIACLFVLTCDKLLKKHPTPFYIGAAVITIAIVAVSQMKLNAGFVRDYLVAIFSHGAIATAFWVLVMWAGAMPVGSAPIKKLMPIRGELSIFAAVLTMAHAVTFGMQYITNILNDRMGSGSAFTTFILTSIVALVLMLIMIPLTVMSFKTIRKKMNAKTWKKIQRCAYVFYALIYIHIIVLFIPKVQRGTDGYLLSMIVYSVVFIGYAVMRIRKWYIQKNKTASKLIPNIVCAAAFLIPTITVPAVSAATGDKQTSKGSSQAPASFSFGDKKAEAETTTQSGETTEKPSTDDAKNEKTEKATEKSDKSSEKTKDKDNDKDKKEDKSDKKDTKSEKKDDNSSESKEEENITEENTENNEDNSSNNDEQNNQSQQEQETAAPEPSYKYKNGTYEGSAEGYAGLVHVSITIENDTITNFSTWADDDDPDYFNDAMNHVVPQIGNSLSADGVDACSGATYSSNGIIDASKQALSQALN